MKQGMTNVDVAALAVELRHVLVGARMERAYQPQKEQVLLRMRRKGLGRLDVLCELGKFLTVTQKPPTNPDKPSMVAQILRQTLENARVIGVEQVGFDRVLRIDFEKQAKHALVFELFGDGNMLLLDQDGVIALPMKGADHGARRLRKGEPYVPPPGARRPFRMDLETLHDAAADANRDVVRFLALGLGFGPQWAEELCARAGVAKNTPIAKMTDWAPIHEVIHALGDELDRNDLAPGIVYDGEEPIDAIPLPMHTYPAPRFAVEEAGSFRDALDVFFLGPADQEDEDPRQNLLQAARDKIARQVAQMQEKLDEFATDEAKHRADGDAIYLCFAQVQKITDTLQAAREKMPWTDVQARIQQARDQGDPNVAAIVEIRPHNGTALLHLEPTGQEPRDVEVDLYKSPQDNATVHFELAKKAVSRQEGARKALKEAETRLADVEKKGVVAFGAAPKQVDRQQRHFWFETYRWTLLPSGLLAVGGRNASQNDQVVKKYLRPSDRYVHAEIHGAPSVVVRPPDGPGVEVSEEDLRVACQFAACASRAWRQFGAASAYWVTPAQVDKTPRSGEFVPKGAWIVHGRRNVESDLAMRWAVGLVDMTMDGAPTKGSDRKTAVKVVGGPPAGVKAWATQVVELEPGDEDVNDAAVRLAERFGVDVEQVQQALPNGSVREVQT